MQNKCSITCQKAYPSITNIIHQSPGSCNKNVASTINIRHLMADASTSIRHARATYRTPRKLTSFEIYLNKRKINSLNRSALD